MYVLDSNVFIEAKNRYYDRYVWDAQKDWRTVNSAAVVTRSPNDCPAGFPACAFVVGLSVYRTVCSPTSAALSSASSKDR